MTTAHAAEHKASIAAISAKAALIAAESNGVIGGVTAANATAARAALASAGSRAADLLALAGALVATAPIATIHDMETGAHAAQALVAAAALPVIADANAGGPAEKRAYSLLGRALRAHLTLATAPDRLALFWSALRDAHALPAARRARLGALARVATALDVVTNADHRALLPAMLGKVISSLKDGGSRLRDAAYSALLSTAKAMATGGEGGGVAEWTQGGDVRGASLTEYFRMVAAGLSADAPRTRAATLLALAKLAHVYRGAPADASLLPSLLEKLILRHCKRGIY